MSRSSLLKTAMSEMQSTFSGVKYLGKVKRDNVASHRVFESLGFQRENTDGYIRYVRTYRYKG